MEKFSIYDLLGLLLPGFVMVFLCNIINNFYQIIPYTYDNSKLSAEIGIVFCLSLIAGAFLYAVNFYLVNNLFFSKVTGMYKEIGPIYSEFKDMPENINAIFNDQSTIWFHRNIFYPKEEMEVMDITLKKEINKLQDQFYSRAYYELEYLDKITVPKTFQSFYFFFRQLATGLMIVSILLLIIFIISQFTSLNLNHPEIKNLTWLWIGILAAFVLSVGHARWYRTNMVYKLYWHYYNHLIQNL